MAWDETARTYDTVAGSYLERFEHELAAKPFDRALLDRFAAAVGDPVVEVGTGPGQVGAYVGQHGRRVIGLDLSHTWRSWPSERLDASVTADLRRLPIASGRVGARAWPSTRSSTCPDAQLGPAHGRAGPGAPTGRAAAARRPTRVGGGPSRRVPRASGAAVGLVLHPRRASSAAAVAAGLDVVDAQRRDPYPEEHQPSASTSKPDPEPRPAPPAPELASRPAQLRQCPSDLLRGTGNSERQRYAGRNQQEQRRPKGRHDALPALRCSDRGSRSRPVGSGSP